MTEADWWDRCTAPQAMLGCVERRGGTENRKLRLFAVACCRRIRTFLTDERSRTAVAVSERHADRLATAVEVDAALRAAHEAAARRQAVRGTRPWPRAWRTQRVAELAAWSACYCLESYPDYAGAVARATEDVAELRGLAFDAQPGHWQCHLLRHLFGNPFRPVTIEPAWLRWNCGCVPRLARDIYAERRFSDLPVLADAAEEAGCDDPDILNHCRAPGGHVRGCWALDLLRGEG